MKGNSYLEAGVDTNAADKTVELIGHEARSTYVPGVLAGVGPFSGLFELKGYKEPVISSSTDGVGTKLLVAIALGRRRSIGIDLVHLCVNDVITSGAQPLFFLDYIAAGVLVPEQVVEVVKGIAEACRGVGCALVGGETAEMPGVYRAGHFDLAGFVVGVVERSDLIDGTAIEKGDVLVGIPSSGIHTNGLSLARKVFGVGISEDDEGRAREREILEQWYPQLGRTLGDELLEPHRSYWPLLKPHLPLIKGMAHISGGGLVGNVPRVLPKGLAASFARGSWSVPPIFSLIQERGRIPQPEMYRTFNMGIGMVLVCTAADAGVICHEIPGASRIGEVVEEKDGRTEFV
ncbi:MAG: phosphoribosylformylglycinamidine cyclo-ligase [Dehalococcoidia bacterium]|nr:phosphoribosylformylglycinamidine cyclo-ligase [Dehalococcoidia bacterium]